MHRAQDLTYIEEVPTQPAQPTSKAAATITVEDSKPKQNRHSTAQSRGGQETQPSRLQMERELEEKKIQYISAKLNCLTGVPSVSLSARSATPQDAQSLSASSAQVDGQNKVIEAISDDDPGALQMGASQPSTARISQFGRNPRDVLTLMLGRLEKDPAYYTKLAARSTPAMVTSSSVSSPTTSTTITTTQPAPSQTACSQPLPPQGPSTPNAVLQEARPTLGTVEEGSQHLKASTELKQSIGSNASIVTAFKELKLEDGQKAEPGPATDTQPDSIPTLECPLSALDRSGAAKPASSKRTTLLPPSVKGSLSNSSLTSPVVATNKPSVASETRELMVSKTSPRPSALDEVQRPTGINSLQVSEFSSGTQEPHLAAAPARKKGPGLESSMFNHISSKADHKNATTGLNAQSEPFISSVMPSTNGMSP